MKFSQHFAPFEGLAESLAQAAIGNPNDGSHDVSHLLRVWKNVQVISDIEGGDLEILTAATLLHDFVDVPKDSPLRAQASSMAAESAASLVTKLGWNDCKTDAVRHAIAAHSFSAQIKPTTIEARILQDADRLDAIGFTGIARCFYVSGRLGRAIYDPEDPIAANRPLDDTSFAIDHFQTKLLKLSDAFQTETGKKLAAKRHQIVQDFMDGLIAEVS